MAYVYRHVRLDKNEPFYIGIGCGSNYYRANSMVQRSKHWKNIKNKTQIRVDIIQDDISWEKACEKEIEFIKLYGREDLGLGSLCNFTNGGEGAYGRIPSKETRNKIAESVKKNSHWKDGRKHTKEAIEKMRISSKTQDRTGRGEMISKGKKGKQVHPNAFANLRKGPLSQGRKVLNLVTQEVFDNMVIAARSINIKPTCLRKKLKGERKNNTNLILL